MNFKKVAMISATYCGACTAEDSQDALERGLKSRVWCYDSGQHLLTLLWCQQRILVVSHELSIAAQGWCQHLAVQQSCFRM